MQKALIVLVALLGSALGCDPRLFNLFVNGDVNCSNSDVEGRVAAGRNLNTMNFAINCMTYAADPLNSQCIQIGSVPCKAHPNDEPAVVVGGSIKFAQTQVYAGRVVYGKTYTATNSKVVTDCSVSKVNWGPLVNAGIIGLSLLSTSYNTYAATGTTSLVENGGQVAITLSTLSRFGIFNVQASDIARCSGLTIDVPANTKLVLINVAGTSATFTNFEIFGTTKTNTPKIMWNFPSATTVTLANFRLKGALLAPRATIVAYNGAIDGQVFGQSYTSGTQSTCAQINNFIFTGSFPSSPPSPPKSTCGDGIVNTGEDCDGGVCCTNTCTFASTATVCRASAGECDVPETCSGVSSSCPTDAFKPVTTPCGSNFGVCDVQLVENCPGNAATCKAAPPAYIYSWDAFNVVSFDSYTCHGGDVEGRLAVRNNLDVSGFTIGLKTLPTDAQSYYELVVAQNATYVDGSVHNGNTLGEIAVGNTFVAPQYLQDQRDLSAYAATSRFDEAQAYYTTISDKIAALGTNAQAGLIYGDGLTLTCDDANSALYIVRVDTATFNNVNWYVTNNCKLTAAWLITLTGNADVNIKGAPFPGIVERVVYNIQGTRTIRANNGVAANILAPNAQYTQSQGVTYGRVIVGNVTVARQNNKPECLNFASITITQKNLVPVKAGDDFVYIYDLTPYIAGDLICANGECKKIVSGVISNDDQGNTVKRVQLASGWSRDMPAESTFTTNVVSPSDASRSEALPIEDETKSSAAALTVSVAALATAVLLF